MILCACLAFAACSKTIQPQPGQSPPPAESEEVASESVQVRNVILLIGDGMGLAQITGGMYLNKNRTALERFPIVGLHKSHSADNLVTDSAAGATAFSSGIKTNNGVVGLDPKGGRKETLLEEAERRGLATGMVVTSTIVHATPAAFIAHVPSRRNYEDIALDFTKTEIDLMIGGGKAFFTRREDGLDLYQKLIDQNYYVTDYFTTPFEELEPVEGKNLAYFTADKDPLPVASGRDYLVEASELSLEFLNMRSDKGFFVMIEGSQIDWGGHANDKDYVINEFLEYDRVIELCYKYAKQDGETLVVVTADHETGGFAINPESTMDELNVAFTTGGHTACMIPVFAFGPGAERFSGVYDNTEIYYKIRAALGWARS
jgi:alkaline phosphatase